MCLNRFGNHWFSFFVFSPICPRAINNLKGHKKMSEPLNLFWLLFINRWSVIIHLRALFVLVFFWGPIYQVHFYIKIFFTLFVCYCKSNQTADWFLIFNILFLIILNNEINGTFIYIFKECFLDQICEAVVFRWTQYYEETNDALLAVNRYTRYTKYTFSCLTSTYFAKYRILLAIRWRKWSSDTEALRLQAQAAGSWQQMALFFNPDSYLRTIRSWQRIIWSSVMSQSSC